ncbi:hypothetical protein CDAR_213281 [Caerostris darwini]|uniref:Uncharacterized protein n=1 Tax=Caerostris darwini TaxID=1538125 RepID=A0AAV4PV22_9ARAC|nr:hypothetical protein CDAR_213281 [Caerostris darwini]
MQLEKAAYLDKLYHSPVEGIKIPGRGNIKPQFEKNSHGGLGIHNWRNPKYPQPPTDEEHDKSSCVPIRKRDNMATTLKG